MAASINLLHSQSTYVLRMNKHSEQMIDIRVKPVERGKTALSKDVQVHACITYVHKQMLFNVRHLLEFSLGIRFTKARPCQFISRVMGAECERTV